MRTLPSAHTWAACRHETIISSDSRQDQSRWQEMTVRRALSPLASLTHHGVSTRNGIDEEDGRPLREPLEEVLLLQLTKCVRIGYESYMINSTHC